MTSISRRKFLRIASLMGGASLFAGCHLLPENTQVPKYLEGAPASDPVETIEGVRNLYSVCALCPGNCGICCRVAGGTVVKIGGSPYHPITAGDPLPFETPLKRAAAVGGALCAIGGSGIQTLYDPFRIAKPLKRVGPRGSGKWKAVSWDEAVREIVHGGDLFGEGKVEGLKTLTQARQGLHMAVGRTDWGSLTFVKRFLASFPGASLVRDHEVFNSVTAAQAADAVYGPGTGAVDADYRRARFLVSFGDAPLDSGVPLVSITRELADARVGGSGMKWAVVDPRLSTSGTKADLWLPIIPGTDKYLAVAVMKVLFEQYPSAVKFTRESVEKVTSSLSLDELARSCGLSVDVPKLLAKLLAENGARSAVIPGGGIFVQPDGLETAKILLALNLMVGSVPGSGGIAARSDEAPRNAEKKLLPGAALEAKAARLFERSAKALLLWQSDPVYSGGKETAAALSDRKNLPLFVAISSTITETAALADYILPDTSYLERWDICLNPPPVTVPGVGIRVPVVGAFDRATGRYFGVLPEPLPMEDIAIKLATEAGLPGYGGDAADNLKTAWDYYRLAIPAILGSLKESGFPLPPSAGDVQAVTERGGVFAGAGLDASWKPARPRSSGYKLPEFTPPTPERPAAAGTFQLISFGLPFHRGPASGVNSWLLEVLPENRVLLNAGDAKDLGIGQGDLVEVDRVDGKASISCKAFVVPGIRPGVAAIARGFGCKQLGASAFSVDEKNVASDKTRGAGVNSAHLTTEPGPVKVRIRAARSSTHRG
jgi:anaerobic selenocysteine-containing dehydrogenase